MARRVFLHIGVPKSGTTYLQTAMWHNRAALRAQGLLYPGSHRLDHYQASRAVRGVSARRLGRHASTWDDLVSAIERWHGDGLISHEFFCLATAEQARQAVERLGPAEVHVVLTVRDYVRQFPAVWQESVKMNSSRSFDQFMDGILADEHGGAWTWASQDLPLIVETWLSAVPPDRLHIVTVPPAGAPRNLLWDRWCAVLGIDATDFDMDLPRANESLGAPQAALMHRLKPHLTGPLTKGSVRHRWVRGYLGHEILVPQGGDRFALRERHARALAERSRKDAAQLAMTGCRVSGDLEDLAPTRLPEARTPDDVPDDELVEVAVKAIDRLVQDVRRLTDERDRWRHRARRRGADGLTRRARRLRRRLRRRVRRTRRALSRRARS
jgi:hypothetical protein